jgi:hypothetical protein
MIVWSFGKCVHGGFQENWRVKKKWTEWVCPCNISYGMQMKKICITGFLLGMYHGCIVTNPNQSMFQYSGNIPVHLQSESLRLCHQLERLFLLSFVIFREYYYLLFRSVVKLWIMQFTENVQANWHEGYCFIMRMLDPIRPEQPRREFKNYSGNLLNICLTAQTWPPVTSICLVC